jgi:hypothetical protein
LKFAAAVYAFKNHPIVKFDISLANGSPGELEAGILDMLRDLAADEGLEWKSSTCPCTLHELVRGVYWKYDAKARGKGGMVGKPKENDETITGVVVLIDEFGDP